MRPAPKRPTQSPPASRSGRSSTATGSASSRSRSPSGSRSSTRSIPLGRNRHHLYSSDESSSAWPKYGQINFASGAPEGRHYSVASPEWADKPYGFANFLRSARFVNSLYNGRLISKKARSDGRVPLCQLPGPALEQDRARDVRHEEASGDPLPQDRLRRPQPGRVDQGRLLRPQRRRHVLLLEVPDQPGRVRRRVGDRAPPTTLDPTTGDVTNASTQPLATFHDVEPAGPELVPRGRGSRRLLERQPVRDRPDAPTPRSTRAASAPSARRRPRRRGGPSTRAATSSSGPTRSPRPRRGEAVGGPGDACTAASPTPRSTSSGSRRSACSRRTTRSSQPPIRGWASASA